MTQSNSAPVPDVEVRAVSLSGAGSLFTSTSDTGEYTLTGVPVGDYRVEARYLHSILLGAVEVTVTAGDTLPASFEFRGARVTWTVIADGEPIADAMVTLEERAPASCEEADFCHGQEPDEPDGPAGPEGEFCDCELGGRHFFCHGESGCRWMHPIHLTLWTDESGEASRLVPEGSFEAIAWSASNLGFESGFQHGGVEIAAEEVMVTDLDDVTLPAASYLSGGLTGVVLSSGQPLAHAQLFARPPLGRGGVWTEADGDGAYFLVLPEGDYEVHIYQPHHHVELDVQPVTVSAGATTPFDFEITGEELGFLSGLVLRDGAPEMSALVLLDELGPASCAEADFCHGQEPEEPGGPAGPEGEYCDCELGGRRFFCDGDFGCRFHDARFFQTHTDEGGAYDIELPAGSYAASIVASPRSEIPESWVSGWLRVDGFTVEVPAGMAVDAGTTSYQTGTVSGQLTSCEVPTSDFQLRLESGPIGWADAHVDAAGAFSVRLPAGTYQASAMWNFVRRVGTQTLEVAAGLDVPYAADGQNGQLRGIILQDGAQAAGAAADIRERGPASCAVADFCHWQEQEEPEGPDGPAGPEGEFCDCELGDRRFFCHGEFGCEWMDPVFLFAHTGSDGTFTVSLPAGDYIVNALSAGAEGQHGHVLVGVLEATVNSCQLVSIGASSVEVEPGEPGVAVVAALGDNITITFASVEEGGLVSFTATSTPPPEEPPPSIEFVGLYYDISVAATFSGLAEVCLPYDAEQVTDPETELRIFHLEDGVWVDVTTSVDTVAQVVCGETSGFSPFVVGIVRGQELFASAGPPIEATAGLDCTALVTLDGSGSSADAVSYHWYVDGVFVGDGISPAVALGPGDFAVQLVVTGATGATATDTTTVSVRDHSPPSLEVSLDPRTIWPPNGKMIPITPSFKVVDNCDPASSIAVVLIGVTSSAADPDDVVVTDPAAGTFSVRAHRRGSETAGRRYTATYRATDAAGNPTTATAVVSVPHDRR